MKIKKLVFAAQLAVSLIYYMPVYGNKMENQDNPSIKALVNPKEVTIGVPVEYRVTVTGKNLKGIIIRLPEGREYYPERNVDEKVNSKINAKDKKRPEQDPASLIPLYIIHNVRKDNKTEDGVSHRAIIMRMSFYRPGKHSLPELEIFDNESIRIGYNIPGLTVKAVNDKGEFQSIEPPLDLAGNYFRLVILIVAVIIFTVVVFIIVRYIIRRRKDSVEHIVVVPPIDIFLKEIDFIKKSRLIESGDIEEFVMEISKIFRKFLSSQMGFDAMEMTASEVMNSLNSSLTKLTFEKYREDFRKILDLWDLAKFAEFMPNAETLFSSLDTTIKIARRLSSNYRPISVIDGVDKAVNGSVKTAGQE